MYQGHVLWEFDHDRQRFRVELQCHPLWGIEAVIFRDGGYLRSRRFYTCELATQWAERERATVIRARRREGLGAATRTASAAADTPAAELTLVVPSAISNAVILNQQLANRVGTVLAARAALGQSCEPALLQKSDAEVIKPGDSVGQKMWLAERSERTPAESVDATLPARRTSIT